MRNAKYDFNKKNLEISVSNFVFKAVKLSSYKKSSHVRRKNKFSCEMPFVSIFWLELT